MGEQESGPEGASPAEEQMPPPDGVDEEQLRQRIEEQLRKVRVQDLLLESVVSIANLAARRIAKEDEQDLEQARVGIEALRAVVDLLEPEPGAQVRNAISELQVLYAKHAQGPGEAAPGESAPAAGTTTPESAETAEAQAGEGREPRPEPQAPPRRRDSGL